MAKRFLFNLLILCLFGGFWALWWPTHWGTTMMEALPYFLVLSFVLAKKAIPPWQRL